MITQLDLYILNSDNSVAPFLSEAEQIVLYDFTFEAQRMGAAPEITATIQATGSLENYLTTKVFCEYNGERYFLKTLPSSSKENTDPRYTFDLTFVSERTILDNVYMIDAVQGNSGLDGYQSNSTTIVFMGDINEAVARLNAAMTYTGVGYSVVIDSGIYTEDKQVSFENKYFTEVLQEYAQIFGIPYYFVGKVAHFGWAQYDVPTVKYLDGLISISKDIQNTRIINRATATGSSDNLPHYYPNPTPRGFITYSVPNGITVNSEHKLALLPVGSSLIYIPETQEIAVKGTYGFNKITDRHPDFSVSDQYATLIIPQYDSSEGLIVSGPVALLKNTFPESKNFTTTVVVRHPKGALSPSAVDMWNIHLLNAIACTRVDDVLVEDASVIVSVASRNTVASQNYTNDEETTFKLNISDFPAGGERYIFLRFLNPSILRLELKIFQFSFSVSERGLLQGWHIQDANSVIDESVVNATDYGLRVTDNFAGGTVSYSVTRKIPYTTTLMPPIYRESNGEQRFYNAINGAYEGITFENEYSPESPKEGITKFDYIKPTIKGATNASDYRIDMFSAFAYDLNDNDATILSDRNTEEYQHPYFYAKLRKIDGPYGFNLFDQALESGEMTVSMTSGACGACKFTIMVDKNTQRNLVMVDDNGNLMRDASGNVMMATDARGLDKQNDTINNEVWVALKKDVSRFGQIMPNVEYSHYPSTSDTFVLLHILMPEVYIKAAEGCLKAAIIDFLIANNSALFNLGINFSRIYLHNNPDVVAILTENSRISIDYNDKLYSYFISSITYRKAKADVLPEISVELTQDMQPTTSNIQAAISAITVTQQQVTEMVSRSEKQPKYLKSDTADTAQGKITFEKGLDFAGNLNTKDFKRGAIGGKGFGVYPDSQGRMIVEADKVISRQGGYGGSGSDMDGYVTTNTDQVITGHKDFAKGISMYGIPFSYDEATHSFFLDANLALSGGVASRATLGSFSIPTIMDGVSVDDQTIIKEGGVLRLNPDLELGGGGLDEEELLEFLNSNNYVTMGYVSTALQGYATVSSLNALISRFDDFLAGADADDIINKWSELEVFLSGLTESDNLATILSTKANKSYVDDTFLPLTGGAIQADGTIEFSRSGDDRKTKVLSNGVVCNAPTTAAWSAGLYMQNQSGGSLGVPAGAFGSGGTLGYFFYGGEYNSPKMVILPNGNIGIGTTSPTEKLHVNGSVKVNGLIYTEKGGVKEDFIHIKEEGYGDTFAIGTAFGGSDDANYLYFSSAVGAAGTNPDLTTKMCILGKSGNVGIGTTAPSEKLHVNGTSLFEGLITSKTTAGGVDVGVKAVGKDYALFFGVGTGNVNRGIYDTTNNSWMLYRDDTKNVIMPQGALHINSTTTNAFKDAQIILAGGVARIASTTSGALCLYGNEITFRGGSTASASSTGIKIDASGNLSATGGITGRSTSDRRLKKNFEDINATEVLMSLGEVQSFEYVDSEVEANPIYEGKHIGLMYQNVVGTALNRMCIEREDGYGSLNYLEPSFISLLAGVCQELVRENNMLKERLDLLERRG